MKFYIVTPSYNAIHWLPRCVRSVADQVGLGVEVHHHVQDGGSKDGSCEWLAAWAASHAHVPGYHFSYASEPDRGMYDAINKAWDLMSDDVEMTAHLNCDEQYLPGALAEVALWQTRNPDADVLLGVYIVTDEQNCYICHRPPVMPRAWSSRLNCACITNSSFYRASTFRRLAPRFDTNWKCVGDLVFFYELTMKPVRFSLIPVYTSLFVCTGENLAWTSKAHDEWLSLCAAAPRWYVKVNGFIYRWVNFMRRVVNVFITTPASYEAYAADEEVRRKYAIRTPSVAWKQRG